MSAQTTCELDRLGDSLLKLLELAHSTEVTKYLREALRLFKHLVPFDSAWWGELSRGSEDSPPRNWTHGGLNLAATFAQEWNRIASIDPFASRSMSQPGIVVHFPDSALKANVDALVIEFSRRHRLACGMAVTLELPGSGLHFFVSVYRADSRPFDERERAMLGWYVRHMVFQWQHILDALRDTNQPWDACALVDSEAVIHHLGIRVGRVLEKQHVGWPGTTLPEAVRKELGRSRVIWTGKSERLVQEPGRTMTTLRLIRRDDHGMLPPRELIVAELYAQGHSSKEIALLVGLTPATVRTYLSSAYRQLGVQNKMQLMLALKQNPSQ